MTLKLDFSKDILTGLSQFKDSKKFSDLKIITGEDRCQHQVHRLVLVINSEYFFDYFSKYEYEDNLPTEIYCQQLNTDIFKIITDFFYTGHIVINLTNAVPLLAQCFMLKIKSVKDEIAKFLISNLSIPEVCYYMYAAKKYNEKILYDKCYLFILKNAERVFETKKFPEFTTENDLIRLLGNDELDASEISIFKTVVNWGEYRTKYDKEYQNLSLAKAVRRLVPYIRFARMTSQEIVDYVQPAGILTPEQLMKILSFQLSAQEKHKQLVANDIPPLIRPRMEGTFRFLAANDSQQVQILDKGLGIFKTGSSEGVVVMSGKKLPEKCSVNIKIEKGGTIETGYIGIGIAEPQLLKLNPCFCNSENGSYITYLNYKGNSLFCCGDLRIFKPYGETFKTGDIIGFDLDLIKGSIKFRKNDKVFPDEDISALPNKELHLAVWLHYAGDKITIVEDKELPPLE